MRHSRGARESVGEAIKGACLIGAGIGYSIGQSLGLAAGSAAGRVEGAIVGCTVTACSCAFVAFVAYLFLKAIRP